MVLARGEETARKNADTIDMIVNRAGVRQYLGMAGRKSRKSHRILNPFNIRGKVEMCKE